MPELPEVETVRRGLVPALEGRRILRAVQNRPDLRWPLPERFAERLTGRRIEGIGRRAKYLLLGLDGGETLLIHLGMSGRFIVEGEDGARDEGADFVRAAGDAKHDHVLLDMEGGGRAIFNDARRFGAMDLWPTPRLAEHWLLAKLGPEPLSNAFDGAVLLAAAQGRRTPLKAFLLDQRQVAGLGNIYVCEALWEARLSPLREAGTLTPAQARRLAEAVRAVLTTAIEAGGSSLRDFRGADGELGYFQHAFRVYDREGEPCPRPRCRGTVERLVQSGRSTFHCPRCQR